MTTIRPETAHDHARIRDILTAAFPTNAEAHLVDALRAADHLAISLVAESDGAITGHIALSPITLDHQPAAALGLAPVAVDPQRQRQGVGAALVRAGLAAAIAIGDQWCVVLGEPRYYARFGFAHADRWRLRSEHDAADAFQAIEFTTGAIPHGGLVRYAPEFAAL